MGGGGLYVGAGMLGATVLVVLLLIGLRDLFLPAPANAVHQSAVLAPEPAG